MKCPWEFSCWRLYLCYTHFEKAEVTMAEQEKKTGKIFMMLIILAVLLFIGARL